MTVDPNSAVEPSDGTSAALRGLGRSWWVWLTVGWLSTVSYDGRIPLVFAVIHLGLGSWVVLEVHRVARTIPGRWARQLDGIAAFSAAALLVEFVTTTLFAHAGMGIDLGVIGFVAAFAGYVLVLGDYTRTLTGAQDVSRIWRNARNLVGAAIAGLVLALVFGEAALSADATHGPNLLTVPAGIGSVLFVLAGFGAILMAARATSLVRIGFESTSSWRPDDPEIRPAHPRGHTTA